MNNLLYGQRFGGIDVLFSDAATEPDGYNWQPSKNRSKRVLKKLFKRFGCYERRKPCMYQIAGRIVAHPSLESEIRRVTKPVSNNV